jgi:hypothetical protein
MSKPLYCWRCKTVVPMLDDQEWSQVAVHLEDMVGRIKKARVDQGLSLAEATNGAGLEALNRYRELTGFRETNVVALWHHRLSMFGPACSTCGKPLRTPKAKHCSECGAVRAH